MEYFSVATSTGPGTAGQQYSEILVIESIVVAGNGTKIVEIPLSHYAEENSILAINGDYDVPQNTYILGIRHSESTNRISVQYSSEITGNVRVNVVYKPII